jgi:hypothetical protein
VALCALLVSSFGLICTDSADNSKEPADYSDLESEICKMLVEVQVQSQRRFCWIIMILKPCNFNFKFDIASIPEVNDADKLLLLVKQKQECSTNQSDEIGRNYHSWIFHSACITGELRSKETNLNARKVLIKKLSEPPLTGNSMISCMFGAFNLLLSSSF